MHSVVKINGEYEIEEEDIDLTVNILLRANKVRFPFKFKPSKIKRLQLLHSKFGDDGLLNNEFKQGSIKVLIKSISVI